MIKLKIENFRSIKKIELYTENNILNLIGPNDSGKSNILDSVNYLDYSTTYLKDDFLYDSKDEYHKKIFTKIHIECLNTRLKQEVEKFIEKWDDNSYAKKLISWLKKNNQIGSIDIKLEKKISLDKNDAISQRQEINNSEARQKMKEMAKTFYEKFFYICKEDIVNAGWNTLRADDASDVINAYNYQNNFFKNLIKSMKDEIKSDFIIDSVSLFLKILGSSIERPEIKKINSHQLLNEATEFKLNILTQNNIDPKESNDKVKLEKWFELLRIDKNNIIELMKKNNVDEIKKILNDAKKNANEILVTVNNAINDVKKGFLEIEFLPNNIFTIFLKNFDDEDVPTIGLQKIQKKSEGIKWMIILYLEILSIKSEKPTILLIDEPEIHLNPYYQKKILELFNGRIEFKTNLFIIYSTHSPFMTMERDNYSKKIIYRSSYNNETKGLDYWETFSKNDVPNPIINTMDLMFSEFTEMEEFYKLLMSEENNVIFVEGVCDSSIIKKILELGEQRKVTVLVMKGWNIEQTIEYIYEKIKKLFKENKVSFIFDNDFAGKKMKEAVLRKLKNEVNEIDDKVKFYSDFMDSYKENDFKLEHFIEYKGGKIKRKSIDGLDFSKIMEKPQIKKMLVWIDDNIS